MPEILFSPINIGTMSVKNRFVRSATHEGMLGEDGLYNERLGDLYTRLAENDVGLIISGHAFVTPGGRASRNQAAAGRDECVRKWLPVTSRIHAAGGKIALQLAHAGGYACDSITAAGPSEFAPSPGRSHCREMTLHEIRETIERFIEAAVRAREGGFDAVQIHAAHGYLLSQFLSGYYNRRTDEYGGTPEKRARMLCEVLSGIRRAVGPEFPILVKLNSEDFTPGGLAANECVELCRKLETLGLDAVELSGGLPVSPRAFHPIRPAGEPPYYRETARRVKAALSIPVILVGGIGDFDTARDLVWEKSCDLVSFSRPLIREPELIRRWRSGEFRPTTCVRCNACLRPILTGRSFGCPRN